jgi:hypothetical protein
LAQQLDVLTPMDKKSIDPRLVWVALVLLAAVAVIFLAHS